MQFNVLTIFPDLLDSPLRESIIRRAREKGQIQITVTDIRDFATDKHSMTDDRPFGGGEGMVMKPEPLSAALKSVRQNGREDRVILLSPQGRQYDQRLAEELGREEHLILVCGRYEGVDERFRSAYIDDEISIGDYILTGGELAAMVIIDSVTRLLPEVLGCADSAEKDTFSRHLLKHPQYTRPREFENIEVPEVLLSGDHRRIDEYRFLESVKRTISRRPDLLAKEWFTRQEVTLLRKNKLYRTVRDIQDGQ